MSKPTKYRVLSWTHSITKNTLFGIQAKRPGKKWFVKNIDTGTMFFTKAEAKAKIQRLKDKS